MFPLILEGAWSLNTIRGLTQIFLTIRKVDQNPSKGKIILFEIYLTNFKK